MTMVESPNRRVDADIDLLRDAYGFEEVVVERVLPGGMFARPVLLRTDRGSFLQRVHAFRGTEPAFRFQAETIEAAWSRGVRGSRVKPTRDGKWCIPWRRPGAVAALHRYAEGSCDSWLAWRRRKESDPHFLHQLGRHIARLHNALADADPGGDPKLGVDLPPIQFCQIECIHAAWRNAIDQLQRESEIVCANSREQLLSLNGRLEAHWERLMIAVQKHRIDLLPWQIVHGDISPVNMVFDADDQMTLIDWDCVHIGHRMYDALGDILNRPPDDRPEWNQFNQSEVDVFIDGYAAGVERPLDDRERQLAPAFCLARQLEDVRQRLHSIRHVEGAKDELYARLIPMRVDIMDQISL